MPVKIRIYGQEATFSQGHWNCTDESLLYMLQSQIDPLTLRIPEEVYAKEVAARYGGLIATDKGWEVAVVEAPVQQQPEAPVHKPVGFLGKLFSRRG